MIYEKLEKNIADAMVEEKNCAAKLKTNFWKSVKTEMVNAVHRGVKLPDDEEEMKILRSMLKRSRNAAEEFAKAGDANQIAVENRKVCEYEASELEKLLPKEASEDEVILITTNVVLNLIKEKTESDPNFNVKMLQRYTKDIIAQVKEVCPTANNGVIARVIKETSSKQ